MKYSRPLPIGLSIVFFLCFIFIGVPSAVVRSQQGPPSSPIKEQIISSNNSLEKLSPDLRELVEAAPLEKRENQRQAIDTASGTPLLVTALIEPGADVQRFFTRSVRSRQVAGFEWITGEIDLFSLRKLASVAQVAGVISENSYETAEAPGIDTLRSIPKGIGVKQVRAILARGGPAALLEQARAEKQVLQNAERQQPVQKLPQNNLSVEPRAKNLLDVHDVMRARLAGFAGQGVTVGVVDTGVDFSHPDLAGTQAVINNTGPYAGWPFAYDTVSGVRYALDPNSTIGPDNYWDQVSLTGYVHTLPVQNATCGPSTCSAQLVLVGDEESGVSARFTWPNTSKSGHYFYSVHPDFALALTAYYLGINYPEGWLLPPAVIVSDETVPGQYDTVYVDVNYNHLLTDPSERMTRNEPLAGASLNPSQSGSEIWDLSAGLLAWISDGINPPPGVSVLYPDAIKTQPPGSGRLLAFIMDQEGHGTSCASLIAGQGRVTDPKGLGPSNILYAGGKEIGGAGGPVITAVAPGAKIAAFQNGFQYPFDAWTLAVFGMDGDLTTADGANIISNSWGDSEMIADGWDATSRFAQQLSYTEAKSVSFLVATGNGGHGYGTRTSPGGGSILDVGASTAYGSLRAFENVSTEQFLYGDVQPWSNRGPGMLGDVAPDIVAVGAWGTAAVPLNTGWGAGQAAYDIFGGTSMSTPVAAGSMAIVYQAFRRQNDRWPTWEEARNLLLTSASDLGYDVNTQGSGNIQVSQAVDMALGQTASISPGQWQAGSYRGNKYPAFPTVMHAGEQNAQIFTVKNPTSDPVSFDLDSSVLQMYHEETFSFAYSTASQGNNGLPIFLKDISGLVDPEHPETMPDLVRAQVVFPFSKFDTNHDYYAEYWWEVYFFDWMDQNKDGNLWTDSNRNGQVDSNEIDIDPYTGLYEFNRFTYGYPQSDTLEASLGRQSLNRQHDGVFLGLGCIYCGESTTLQVRLTFYRKVDWGWLTLSNPSIQVPGKGQVDFSATLSIPAGTKPGAYEGEIEVTASGKRMILPVVVHVAANSTTFDFGAAEALGQPYDNAHMFGGFNWDWRYESGDWRMFYTDVPDNTAAPGKAMIVDTLWAAPATDIDTWLLEPSKNIGASPDPAIFGPYSLSVASGSDNTYARDGKFFWKTNTGTSHEMVSAPVKDGLNLISLHNVLSSGLQFAEQFIGRAYQVTSDPGQLIFASDPDTSTPPYLSGSQKIVFTSTGDIADGIQIQPFGMSPPIDILDQEVRQDSPSNICSASWIYQRDAGGLDIHNGGVLDITTASADSSLDLDLYLFIDNGDGIWNCSLDTLKAYSINSTADEEIKIYFPEDGKYWVLAHGNRVPGGKKPFDMRIRAISGTDLTLENIPIGPIRANQPVELTVNYHGKYASTSPAALEGLLLIGTPSVQKLLEVPVRAQPTILLSPAPGLWSSSRWVAQTPVTFSLGIQNLGVNLETAQAAIRLPAELVYEYGSASGPGVSRYDPTAHMLYWECTVGGAEKVIISFRATAQPDQPSKQVEMQAQVKGVTSELEWMVKTTVWINQYGMLLPLIGR